MEVQHLSLARGTIAFGIAPADRCKTDASGAVKIDNAVNSRVLFSVFCEGYELSCGVTFLVDQLTVETTVSDFEEGQSSSVNLESKFG